MDGRSDRGGWPLTMLVRTMDNKCVVATLWGVDDLQKRPKELETNSMISTQNPVKGSIRPCDIDRRPLLPQRYTMRNGKIVNYFADNSVGLVKMDFIFEAGTSLQDRPLQAAAAINLVTEGTRSRSAREIAEFFDFRGIIVEKSNDEVSSTLTVYAAPRYMDELVPLLYELLHEPAYDEAELEVFVARQRQKLMVNLQRTSYVARKRWCECVYGSGHPLGRFAVPSDFDGLSAAVVRDYHRRWLTPSRMDIVLGGAVSEVVLAALDRSFGGDAVEAVERTVLPQVEPQAPGLQRVVVADAVQASLRVGRLLPLRWDDRRYAEFMVLSVALGGYFGSRLMSNIREDKGYTYGINAMTHIDRGSLDFFVVTDVAADKADAALEEIWNEMQRLRNEPIMADELELVRTCMLGDFMRSVDGVFERSERFCQQMTSGVDERFTDNYMSVLEPGAVSGSRLQQLAFDLLDPSAMVAVNCGNKG